MQCWLSCAATAHPREVGHRAWLVGGIALVLFLLVDLFLAAFFGGGPGKGFFGLLFGYGLL